MTPPLPPLLMSLRAAPDQERQANIVIFVVPQEQQYEFSAAQRPVVVLQIGDAYYDTSMCDYSQWDLGGDTTQLHVALDAALLTKVNEAGDLDSLTLHFGAVTSRFTNTLDETQVITKLDFGSRINMGAT